MPLYEERIICPLAVRFTQEHVRPVFQDGRELENTIKEIKQKPGIDDYDVILEVPFQPVEIIRWKKRDESGIEPKQEYWFTFDNRRLYCLQRCAVALWPKRVGTVVQALYGATDGSHRKDNSLTAGRCVWIGHSLKTLTDGWDWRDVVGTPMTKSSSGSPTAAAVEAKAQEDEVTAKVLALITRDDQRAGWEDLCGAPAPPSMLDLFFEGGCDEDEDFVKPTALKPEFRTDSEDSTAVPSTPRSGVVSEDAAGRQQRGGGRKGQQKQWSADYLALSAHVCGEWIGDKKENYRVDASPQGWKVARSDAGGTAKKFTLWYDENTDLLWWGTNWTMYVQGSELREKCNNIQWYGNNGSWKPWFTWKKQGTNAVKAPLQEGEEGEEDPDGREAPLQEAAPAAESAAGSPKTQRSRGGQRNGTATRRGRRG